MSQPPGVGRGSRGLRLMTSLQKRQALEPAQEQASGSGATGGATGGTASGTPPAAIGKGRGKLTKLILQKPSERGDSPSPTRTPSPDTGGSVTPAESTGDSTPTSPTSSSPKSLIDQISSVRISPKETTGGGRRPPPDPIPDKAHGNEGKRVTACVNYVKVNVTADGLAGIYEYHVRFEPNVDSRDNRNKIMRSAEVKSVIGEVIQFTGMNLYLPMLLDNDDVTISARNIDGSQVSVHIIYIKKPPHNELIPFYNTMFRRIMNILRMVQINRHYYDPTGRIEIPQHKLEVWPGYVTAVQDYDGGLMLNCDASHRILRTNTARDVLQDLMKLPDGKRDFKVNAQKRLIGCVVLTRYNNKPYRIDDISFDSNPESTFTKADGSEITYIEYFKKSWQKDIQDKRQPLLVHRPKARKGEEEPPMVCLIPELSYMTGLTDDIRADTRAMRDIASHTRIRPEVRQAKLLEFVRNVHENPAASKVLSDWGLELESRTLETTARIFPGEMLMFGNTKTAPVNAKADWTRDATGSAVFRAVNIERWILIYVNRDAAKAEEFAKGLHGVSRNMGFTFGAPRRVQIANDLPATYCQAIKDNVINTAQLIVLITPGSSQREDRYNAIKKLCCCELPIPSQVVRGSTLNPAGQNAQSKFRSVCQKIALQISCKVGGQLWAVKIPFQSCMIVGMDVYHDAAHKGKSVVGVICSINKEVTRWYTRVYFQNTQQEMVSTLQTAMIACLKKYHEVNHCLPARIFLFRDGVGDGQMSTVKDFEIPQMAEAIESFSKCYQGNKPAISVIIVQKKINTKILLQSNSGFDNPPPGTVVDDDVTRPFYYDFFIVSQHVTQGTVTPTHYVTLHDENNMTPDRMQKLTYKMSHLYYNWPGTIRVPAPCQYAHKVAYLIGQNVKKLPSDSLCDKLFFL